jgi:hypothetical protein
VYNSHFNFHIYSIAYHFENKQSLDVKEFLIV